MINNQCHSLAQFMRHIIFPLKYANSGTGLQWQLLCWSSCIKRFLFQVEACSREQISWVLAVAAHPLYSEIEATLEAPIGRWKSSVYGNDGTTLLIACSSKPKTHWRNCPRVLKTGKQHQSPIWARRWRFRADGNKLETLMRISDMCRIFLWMWIFVFMQETSCHI